MRVFFNRFFLGKYDDDSEQIRKQATAICLISGALFLLTASLMLIITEKEVVPLLAIASLFCILMIILVRAGRQKLSGLIMIPLLSVLLGLMVITIEYTEGYEVYFMTLLQIFVLFISLLITTSSIHSFMTMAIGTGWIIYEYFQRARPAMLGGLAPDVDDYIIAAALLIFSGLIVVAAISRNRKLLDAAAEEGRLNRSRADRVTSLLNDLRSDLDTGDRLVASAEQVSDLVAEIKSGLEIISSELRSLSEATSGLKDSSHSIRESSDVMTDTADSQNRVIEQSSSAIAGMTAPPWKDLRQCRCEKVRYLRSSQKFGKSGGCNGGVLGCDTASRVARVFSRRYKYRDREYFFADGASGDECGN